MISSQMFKTIKLIVHCPYFLEITAINMVILLSQLKYLSHPASCKLLSEWRKSLMWKLFHPPQCLVRTKRSQSRSSWSVSPSSLSTHSTYSQKYLPSWSFSLPTWKNKTQLTKAPKSSHCNFRSQLSAQNPTKCSWSRSEPSNKKHRYLRLWHCRKSTWQVHCKGTWKWSNMRLRTRKWRRSWWWPTQ